MFIFQFWYLVWKINIYSTQEKCPAKKKTENNIFSVILSFFSPKLCRKNGDLDLRKKSLRSRIQKTMIKQGQKVKKQEQFAEKKYFPFCLKCNHRKQLVHFEVQILSH